jgi:hypothetical protein
MFPSSTETLEGQKKSPMNSGDVITIAQLSTQVPPIVLAYLAQQEFKIQQLEAKLDSLESTHPIAGSSSTAAGVPGTVVDKEALDLLHDGFVKETRTFTTPSSRRNEHMGDRPRMSMDEWLESIVPHLNFSISRSQPLLRMR